MLKTVLFIAGALLEAGGLTLAVLDLRERRHRLRQYRHRPQRVQLGSALELDVAFPMAAVKGGGPPPSLDERLQHVENYIASHHQQHEQDRRRYARMVIEKADDAQAAAKEAARRDHDALSDLVAQPPGWKTWIALVLFVLGLLLSTVGNIIA